MALKECLAALLEYIDLIDGVPNSNENWPGKLNGQLNEHIPVTSTLG